MSTALPSRATGGTVAPLPLADLAGLRVGLVLWGGLALLDAGRLAGAPAYLQLAALALLVMGASVGMGLVTAMAAALVAWLLFNGFVIHRLGVLGFDGTPDLARLAVLAGLAMIPTRARR